MSEIKRIFSLNGDTLIPLSLTGIILAAGYWLNNVNSRIEFTEQRISTIDTGQERFQDFARTHMEEQSKSVSAIKEQTAAIEAQIEILLDMNRKNGRHPP